MSLRKHEGIFLKKNFRRNILKLSKEVDIYVAATAVGDEALSQAFCSRDEGFISTL